MTINKQLEELYNSILAAIENCKNDTECYTQLTECLTKVLKVKVSCKDHVQKVHELLETFKIK